MNEKLRTILRNAWTEPRHFFLWLALASILGFVAVAASMGLRDPTRVLAVIAVGGVLCFLASIVVFVLAWIPPIRRFLSWVLQRRFLALGCLVTLVALFYAVENWRGRRAWQHYERTRQAEGEHFDMTSLAPPPVPENQNFFETPLWNGLHFVQTNNRTIWSDTNWGEHVVFSIFGPKSGNAPSTGDWMRSHHMDLAAWQAFFRGSNNVFTAPGGPPTNYFSVASEPQTPPADVLLALSRFENNRQLLVAAARRPYSRFWINYDAGQAMLLPHLARLKASAQYLSLHADAALKVGDRETALEDVRLLFRLIESIRGEPILISHLVRMAMLQIGLQPVWEGLADRQWTEKDLGQIESELGKLDFVADYEFALRGERACGLWAVDYIHKNGPNGLELFDSEGNGPERSEWEKFLVRSLFRLVPAGWFDQNKLSFCRTHENVMLSAVDAKRGVILPGSVAQSQAALLKVNYRLYDLLSKRLLPSVTGAAQRFARAQATADLAQVACALERYRLANAQFPDSLEALAPKFIEKLPHDIINGQPLKYRRTEDGQFVLYSVGWNQTDDGGKVQLTKNGYVDLKQGDWVWRFLVRGSVERESVERETWHTPEALALGAPGARRTR